MLISTKIDIDSSINPKINQRTIYTFLHINSSSEKIVFFFIIQVK